MRNNQFRWLIGLTGSYDGFPLEPWRTGGGRPSPSPPPPAAHRDYSFPEKADVDAHVVAHFVGNLDQASHAQHLYICTTAAHARKRTSASKTSGGAGK